MAVLLLLMIGIGLFMGSLPRGDELKALLIQWHLIVGCVVLILAFCRLILRFRMVLPALPDRYPPWRRRLIAAVHAGFYVLMIGLPVLGLSVWAIDPFVGGPAIFGEAVWVSNTAGYLHRLHYLGAWLLLLLLVLHVTGAMSKDDRGTIVLKRMFSSKR